MISMTLGITAGAAVGTASGSISLTDFRYGLQYYFDTFDVTYTLLKTLFFAFIITSVSSYHGYYTRGGALEVGQSSTRAVVYSIILIMICNYMLTQIMLL
jgi:phospholipid/cholesterol/gamma-HCH transport system permease protein